MSSAAASAANVGGRRLSAVLPDPIIITQESAAASGSLGIPTYAPSPAPGAGAASSSVIDGLKLPNLEFGSTPKETPMRSSGYLELSSTKVDGTDTISKKQLLAIKKNNFPELMRSICLIMIMTGNVFMSSSLVVAMDDSEEVNTFGSIRTLIQITGPLLFYYAGRQEALSAGNILTSFIKKSLFLMLPSGIGLFLLVLPSAYITRGWNVCGFPSGNVSFSDFAKSYLANFKCVGFD